MNILQRILRERESDVAVAKQRVPVAGLKESMQGRVHRSLRESLCKCDGTRIIAEMKKASPSAGLLRSAYRPVEIARRYREAGAAALSVLTEPRHFKGSGSDLRDVRRVVELPILRKDFLCDVYQVYEAAAWGADVILLIVAALEEDLLATLYREAVVCGLEVLVEAHTAEELDRALALEDSIVGVNSRDLKTLRTDLSVAQSLAARIPRDRVAVAESGIRSRADVEMLQEAGYSGFLVGEALMRGGAPEAKLRELIGSP